MLTQADIEKLNRTRSAVNGKSYTADNGNEFVGVGGGRVILKPVAENVVSSPTSTTTSTNVQGALNSITSGGWIPLTFTGFQNGVNTVFTFNDNVDFLFYNGSLQTKDKDYTLSTNGKIVTMLKLVYSGEPLNGFKNN